MEPVLFINHRRHAEGQWDMAKNSHTSFKSMEFHIPQLWLCKMLLWVMQHDGFLGRKTPLSAFDSFQKDMEGRNKQAQLQSQNLGVPTSATWHQQLHRDTRRWSILLAGLSCPCPTVSCSRQSLVGALPCASCAHECWGQRAQLTCAASLRNECQEWAQSKFVYIKKTSLCSPTYAPESLWHLLKLGLPYTSSCCSLNLS